MIRLSLAAVPPAALLVLGLLGARAQVAFLSGSLPPGGWDAVPLGLAYLMAWFATWLVSPVLVLSWIMDVAWRRLR